MKEVGIFIRATMQVPDGQDLDELAESIKQRGLGPECDVRVNAVLVTDGLNDGDA